jgi:hypothetical protein
LEIVREEERPGTSKKEGVAEGVEGCRGGSEGEGGNMEGLKEGRGVAIDLIPKSGLAGNWRRKRRG